MAVRFQIVPGRELPDLLELPWSIPLEEWDHARTVRMAHGVSRHPVRFVAEGERVYALKETTPADAEHEYAMLRLLRADGMPTVEPVGIVLDREADDGTPLGAVLITRFLDYSLPFRYLFGFESGTVLGDKLVDSAAVLLTRLHLDGFYWGDCSLSNLLFRRDAGGLMAYLVDAETVERNDPLPEAMREHDLALAVENVAGGLLDLQAAGRLAAGADVLGLAERLRERYCLLWEELTGTLDIELDERHLIEGRLRRLNDLGFDATELVIEHDAAQDRVRMHPVVVEEGHHSRELRRLTGLDVQENQARRLLNDIAAYGVHLAHEHGQALPAAVVASRWITDVYEPVVHAVPAELAGRLEPPELFHEFLEHRYYLAEQADGEVDDERALASYLDDVLRNRPDERLLIVEE